MLPKLIPPPILALLALLALQAMTSALPTDSLRTIHHIANIAYYVSDAVAHLDLESHSVSGPCTVIPFTSTTTTKDIEDAISTFDSQDDVWSSEYLQIVVLDCVSTDKRPREDIFDLLGELGARKILYRSNHPGERPLPWGPYWLENQNIHKVLRLYSHEADAFVVSTVQNGTDHFKYRPLGLAIHGNSNPGSLSVAVPSRLYYNRSADLPLAGLRIAVKDNTDLEGIRTGGSSRSYTSLRNSSNQTAPAVRRLLEMGAVVVGKTKTTQFADTEWATGDWVDFHAPFSPRADGYQSPSGSSAGSGAAMAAYQWLDFATGTDGCGSLRSPAAVEGLFTLRPSHGSVSVKGVIPWGSEFDTFGGLARDINTLSAISRALYPSHFPEPRIAKPKRIFCPTDFWSVQHEDQRTVFDNFIAKLEAYMDVKCESVSLADSWKQYNPVGSEKSLAEYFNNTLPWAYAPTQYQTYKTFQEEFFQNLGHAPYFNPESQHKMKWLPTVTSEMHQQALKELGVFKEWFESNIIPVSKDGDSEALLLLPWTTGIPDYRDIYRHKPEWEGHGWFYYMIAPFAKAPEIILPIGQTSFVSRVSGREEWLPASIGIIGARGSDAILVSLLQDVMEKMLLQTSTLVGRMTFPISSSSDTETLISQDGFNSKLKQAPFL
ncbi:MAG: hypothetical protein Q9190_004474 [Brigantiaea leucoxantha]